MDCKGDVRSIYFDNNNRLLFTCCLSDGKINLLKSGAKNLDLEKKILWLGEKNCRKILYLNKRREIVVGFSSGIIVIYNNFEKGIPIYSKKIHLSDITQIQFIEKDNILITSSKDKSINLWKLPNNWEKISPENETNNTSDNNITNNTNKEPKFEKVEEDEDDDLLGWNN